jgi:hypothetical protein
MYPAQSTVCRPEHHADAEVAEVWIALWIVLQLEGVHCHELLFLVYRGSKVRG